MRIFKKIGSRAGIGACILATLLITVILVTALVTGSQNDGQKCEDETVIDTVFLSRSSLPDVSAKAAVLMDADSGNILGAKNPDERLPMASTTKIMTALVAIEQADVSRMVEISPAAVGVEGSSIYLYEGERLSLEDLLYAMLLESANDAAAAIAIEIGGSLEGFAEMMNEKAVSLGLRNTHFENPHGLDGKEHYTTAHDLALIARAALENEVFAKIVSTYKKTIPLDENDGVRLLINHNKLLKSYDGAIGVKTGFTKKSGRCLVSAAERGGMRLICVTLNAPDDWRDHKIMLDHGFGQYSSQLLCNKGYVADILPIVGGKTDHVTAICDREVRLTLPRAALNNIERRIELSRFEYAPVTEGDRIGTIIFTLNGEELARVPLIAGYSSEKLSYKKSLWERIISFFK